MPLPKLYSPKRIQKYWGASNLTTYEYKFLNYPAMFMCEMR